MDRGIWLRHRTTYRCKETYVDGCLFVCFSFYVSRFLILVSTSDERAKKDNKREKKSPKKWEFCHVQQLLRNVYVNSRAISIRRHYKAGY